jgi:nucleotide-binding universal stress UspA family protein
VLLVRTYQIPANRYAGVEDYYAVNYEQIRAALKDEAQSYLANKVQELRRKGIDKVFFAIRDGFAADEIVALGRETSDNLIAMSTHGRSGVKRWALGSVLKRWFAIQAIRCSLYDRRDGTLRPKS